MKLTQTDLLLVIDVQNDFCPGGALAVTDGDAVVSAINNLSSQFSHVVLTQDWHPASHSSFASSHQNQQPFSTMMMAYGEQTLWPDHCIQGTTGAEFHADLNTSAASMVIRKGMNPAIDSYSAFFENDHLTSTGLCGYIQELGIERIFCAGLAFDFCVRYSAEDARSRGFETCVITDACRAIDMNGSSDAAHSSLKSSGIHSVDSNDLIKAA